MERPIYLDYNATTPIDPAVAAAMRPYLEEFFGNPSSSHWYGAQTQMAVSEARRQVAALLGAQPAQIVFTSGGSEANNYAIKGAARARRDDGRHIITTAIEHPAVDEVCRYLEGEGFLVTRLPVDAHGLVSPDEFEAALRPDTILLSVMHANNETGSIQPVRALADIAHRHGVLVHSDAAQSVGKIPVDVDALGVDLLSVAGHKFYGPKGIGALYLRPGVRLEKLIHGANHEQNLRAGTENVLEIVGLGAAAALAGERLEASMAHNRALRDRLHGLLQEALPDLRLNGHPEQRLPNTLNVSFPHVEANTLLAELPGVAASAGAACHAENVEVSTVIAAMGVPQEVAMGTVRFSTGRLLSRDDVDNAARQIIDAVRRLRPSEEAPQAVAAEQEEEVRLTRFTHGLGCACKLRPQALEEVLRNLPVPDDPRLLVGSGTADDAAVWLVAPGTAIVQTVDFFTPIVDDPYHFGAIAAANALSDVYAMGGEPLFALNVVGFPTNRLPLSVLEQILAGASDKAAQAGIPIVGGHTVDDTEPKFGMVVTGQVDPAQVRTNAAARPGDVLVLTKPIGTGIVTTALKRGLVDEETTARVIGVMSALNRDAAAALRERDVGAVTDVTGFGLLGHLREITRAAGVDAVVDASMVPVLDAARGLVADGVVPGGTRDNEAWVADTVRWDETVTPDLRALLCDAQTSGGLLVTVAAQEADALLADLRSRGVAEATVVGHMGNRGEGLIRVKSA